MLRVLLISLLLGVSMAQNIGTNKVETHLPITIEHCTKGGQCTPEQKKIVLDSNWRWCSKTGTYQNCYKGNEWDKDYCPDPQTCAQNCALEGVLQEDWKGTYGISGSDNGVTLGYVTKTQYGTNVGSRVYLLDDDSHYMQFKMLNQEFTFTVDASHLPCGLNGALYMVEMEADGGMSKYSTNKCGAKYGTGYCDAQCPRDMKWIHGEANTIDWTPDPNNPTRSTGKGKYGTCCNEMDLWEANSMSQAYTPHSCTHEGEYRCGSPAECGDVGPDRYSGVCDKDGCDYATYRLGAQKFYGPGSGFVVDSTKPVTVVTQFFTTDNTTSGELSEIRRLYVQNGKVIHNQATNVGGKTYDSVTDPFCKDRQKYFGDHPSFETHGGLKTMGGSLGRGMVLVMSLWDDDYAHMLWLDSKYPTNGTGPGVARGTCPTTGGVPGDVERQHPNSPVTYSNIKYGDIGSTYP